MGALREAIVRAPSTEAPRRWLQRTEVPTLDRWPDRLEPLVLQRPCRELVSLLGVRVVIFGNSRSENVIDVLRRVPDRDAVLSMRASGLTGLICRGGYS